MSENRMELILNSSSSFGKLNIILYFKVIHINFEEVYKDIIDLFNPVEINSSYFDLENMEMRNIEFPILSIQNNNSILRIILINEKEEIIIEYYQGQIIVEHLFKPIYVHGLKGDFIIKKYMNEIRNYVLAIGYELSIDINSFEPSLKNNISDKSLHPIFVMKNVIGEKSLIEEYISDNSKINDQKVNIIKEYFKLIDINPEGRYGKRLR